MKVLFMVNIPSPYRVDFFDELGKLCDLTVVYERTDKCVSGLELIENGKAGYVIPSDDVNILSNKIKQIINDDQSREQMAVYNLEKIKEYTIEQMAKIHMNIFKKYTERKH